jgi:hypothetical protein
MYSKGRIIIIRLVVTWLLRRRCVSVVVVCFLVNRSLPDMASQQMNERRRDASKI